MHAGAPEHAAEGDEATDAPDQEELACVGRQRQAAQHSRISHGSLKRQREADQKFQEPHV